MTSPSKDIGRKYATQCTGAALQTVKEHTQNQDITLFAGCFCPFVQRVWVALEYLEIPYKYYEVDPYKKPSELLEISPKGLVPALKLFGERGRKFDPPRGLNESTVILEYLESLAAPKRSLLPSGSSPYAIALVRLQADHVNRDTIPAFYRYIQAQDAEKQIETGKEFYAALEVLVSLLERAEREVGTDPAIAPSLGLWMENGRLGWLDVMVGPWLFRATNVLAHYRSFQLPPSQKFNAWLDRVINHPAFKKTCSEQSLYIDSYERYAFNRPNTSLVAEAINSGRSLP